MHPTYLFYLLIFINLIFFFRPDFLYKETIFFIPFSATSVLNFSLSGHQVGIQPIFLSASFLLLSYACQNILYLKEELSCKVILITKDVLIYSIFSISFIVICLISIFYYLYSGKYGMILNAENFFNPFTQLLYLIFGIVLSFFIAIYNNNVKTIYSTLRVLLVSGIFVVLWGVMQLCFYYLHMKYPDFLFNNSQNLAAAGYRQVLGDLALKRVSSVAVEPSILGQFLLVVFGIMLIAKRFKIIIFNLIYDRFLIFFFLLGIVITTSSSAIISLGLLILMYFFYKTHKITHYGIRVLIIISIVGILIYFVPLLHDYVNHYLINKLATGSGIERMGTIKAAFFVFLQNPLFGYGWGGVRCYDIVVLLLATTGILGAGSFCLYVVALALRLHNLNDKSKHSVLSNDEKFLSCVFFIILMVTLFCNEVAGLSYVFATFWFVLGMCIALCSILRKKLKSYAL